MPASYRTRGIINQKEEKQEEPRKNAHRYAGLDPYAEKEDPEEKAKKEAAARAADKAIAISGANAGVNVAYGAAEATEGASDFLRYTPKTVKAIALEGVAKILGNLAGTVGWQKAVDYFSKVEEYEIGKQNKIQEKIDYDLAGDVFGRDAKGEGYLDWQWGNKLSEQSQDVIGENANRVLEEVSQGVGGMLPMVAVSIASGGAYAGLEGADAIAKAAQATKALQTGLFFAQAAGQATESAGKRGATPKAALVYGLASGAVEAGTEWLGGSVFGEASGGLIGKGLDKIAPGLTNRILASTGGQLLWTFAGEAFEEGLSHVIDPYLDAGAGIADLPTWDEIKSGLLEDMAVGGTVGVLLNGLSSGISNIQNHSKGGSTYTKTMRSMQTVLDAMQANEAVKASSKSTQDRVNRMETATAKLIQNELNKMSTELKKMTATERAGAFSDAPVLSTWLDENGNIRKNTAAALQSQIESGKASNTSDTVFDANAEAANLAQVAQQVGQSVKVDNTELNPTERKNFASVLKANSELNKAYQDNRVVIYTGADESIKAFVEPKKIGNTVYISRSSLSNGEALQKYFHEDLGHLQELYRSTQAISELAQDEQLREKAIKDLAKSDNQGLTEAEIRNVIDSVQRETDVDQLSASEKRAYEEYVARLIEFSGLDSKSASRIVAENPTGFGKLADAIRSFVENRKTKKLTDAERSRLQSMRRAERIIRNALDNRKSARVEAYNATKEARNGYIKDRATYLGLEDSKKEKWLKDHGYTAEDFAPGVLEKEDISTLPQKYREEYLAASKETEQAETKKAAEAGDKEGDVKFSKEASSEKDSSGRTLSVGQAEYFKDSKVRDEDGRLMLVYHGSPAVFTEFSHDFMSRNGSSEGQGFYFTDKKSMAEGYQKDGGQLLEGYLNISNPLSDSKKTLKKSEVRKLLKAIDPTGDDVIINYDPSGKGYPSREWYNRALEEAVNMIFDNADTDSEILAEIANSGAVAETTLKTAKDVFGYDGYIVSGKYKGANVYVAFTSEQFKNADNLSPTSNPDIRFSKESPYTSSEGAVAGEKVYSKKDAQETIEAIVSTRLKFEDPYSYSVGKLNKTAFEQATSKLFKDLNNLDPGKRGAAALNLADYIVEKALVEQIYDEFSPSDEILERSADIVSLMNSMRHKLRLDRYKGDIIYTNDKKPGKGLLLQWAASEKNRSSAVGLDQLVDLFDEIGVKLEGDHPADIFQNALEMYEDAKVHLDEALGTVRLSKFASEEQIKNLKQQIAKDILLAYDEKGEPSKLKQRLNDAYAEIESLQKELQDERGISKLRLQVLRDLRFLRAATNRTYAEKNGIAISANLLDDPTFHDVAKAVSSVMRGDNISPKNVRERMLDLRKTFFSSDNTILQDWIDSFGQNENDMGQITADQIIQALDTLNLDAGDGTEFSNEPLSYKEWQAFSKIAKFIKKVYTDYDSYYEDGKRYVLSEKAKDYQKVLQFANDTRNGRVRVVQNLFTNYEQAFGTPRTWARMVDGYNDSGFFTHTQYRLEKDSWKQQIEEDRIDKAVDDFVKKHKGYEKRLRERIAYDGQAGTKILVAEAIDIYLQSTQANGLLTLTNEKGGGFHYTGEDGKRAPNTLHFTKESLDSLFQSFTAEDKEFMALIMAGYEEAGKLRHDTNIRLTGFSSEVKDRYYPLRREGSNIQSDPTNAAHALRDIQAMNNLSWNKQRRTNALAIPLEASNALEKFYRHIHQSTMFWAFSEDLHNIRRIYNKDFSATRSGEQTIKKMLDYAFPVDYAKGERKNKADVYFTKLLNDIQGVSTKERTAFSRGMQKLRGAYATASLGVNIKVSLAQLASIPNAYQYIDASVMLKALVAFQSPANAKQRTEQMDEFSKTALVRHLDKTVVQSEALLDKVGKISDKLTYLIQFNDRMAISFLWKCAQLQVAKDTGYAVGTEENLTRAGELLDEINTVTQPTYQATDRSAFQRSDNEVIKSLAMFKSVPTKQLSMLFDAYGEATALPRQIKYLEKQLQNQSISAEEREAITNQVKDLKDRQKQSGKKVARATVAVIAAQAMYTAIGFAVTKFILRKLDDDESPLKTLLISYLDSMVSILPIIGDIYDLIFHGRELEDVSLNMMNTVFTDITKTFTADDDAARARAFRNLGIDVTMMFGLPTRNARNLFLGMTKNISPSLYDSIEAPFTTPKTTGITDALKAGNLDIARNTTRRVMAAKGFGISESQAEVLTDLYGSGYDLPSGTMTKYTVDGVEYTLTDAEKDNFALVYSDAAGAADDLVDKAAFNKLTDKGKDKAISTVYSFYRDKAKVEAVGIDASKLYLFGTAVDPTQLALILAGVNDLLDKAKASGKEYDRKALVTEFLKRQDLTAAQKYMLMGYFGYKNTNGAEQVKSYINRLQLTKKEKQALYEKSGYGG